MPLPARLRVVLGSLACSVAPVLLAEDLADLETSSAHDLSCRYDDLDRRELEQAWHAPTTGVGPVYAYEAVARSYDAKGNLTSDGTLGFGYDAWNRLTSVSDASGTLVTYELDALGRRSKRIEASGQTTRYVYSGARLLEEYEATSETGPFTLKLRYLYGGGLDELVAIEDDVGTRYYVHQDALGSVEAITDASGSVLERYRYDAFGVPTVTNADGTVTYTDATTGRPTSPLGNALWFTGARWDPESGHYHMRARQYEPAAGRFVSRDPLGYVDGPNAYAYGFSDPANWTDPWGLEAGGGSRAPESFAQEPERGVWATIGHAAGGAFVGVGDFARGTIEGLATVGVEAGLMVWDGLNHAGDALIYDIDYTSESRPLQWVREQSDLGRGGFEIAAEGTINTVAAPFYSAGYAIADGIHAAERGDTYNGVRQATDGFGQAALTAAGGVWAKRGAQGAWAKLGAAWDDLAAVWKSFRRPRNGDPPACGDAARGGSALSRAGQALDRGGLTRAGRALEKHGSRPASVFPKATGNVAAKNAQGQAALDDILGNVGRTSPNKFGGLDYFGGSRGGGARFDAQGNLIGFLEP